MIEQAIAVTNNKMAADKLEGKMEVIYIDGTLMDVLKISRDYIHKGHRL
ncbi:MAG TPA: GrdX protein, partial [Clostridiaceae bacterium]|nr:GrdX protein [Clostridiaceae bacterium]